MSIADTTLGPMVWNVPSYSHYSLGKLKRWLYCLRHAQKLRMYFLGMLGNDPNMSGEDKAGFYEWLAKVDWVDFLANVRDTAHWKRFVDHEPYPIHAALFQGINCEYRRLYRCYKDGYNQNDNGVI